MPQPFAPRRLAVILGLLVACSEARPAQGLSLPRPTSARDAFDGMRGGGGVSGITPLTENDAAWGARWEAIAAARHSIDATYFILENDVFGLAFLGLLYQKALEGVRVRVLIDGRGSSAITTPLFGRDYLQELVATGNAEVRVFNPPLSQVFSSLAQVSALPLMAGTHNKILLIDGKIGFTGGRNIARQYFADAGEDEDAHIDTDVLVTGEETIAELEDAMLEEWRSGDRDDIRAERVNHRPRDEQLLMLHAAMDAWLHARVPRGTHTDEAALALEGVAVAALEKLPAFDARRQLRPHLRALAQVGSLYGLLPLAELSQFDAELRIVAAPGRAQRIDGRVTDALLRAIMAAQRDVVLQSPYVVLTPAQLEGLIAASLRGVRITLITNSASSTDNLASQALFMDTWPELCARIPTLRIFVGADERMMHAKVALIDDDLTLIGTYNLDPFSAYVNSEMFVAAWSKALNKYMREDIAALARRMIEYRIERDDDGVAVRGADGKPVIAFGPADHLARYKLRQLALTKPFVVATRGLWNFEVVAW